MGFFSKPDAKQPAPTTPVSRPSNPISPTPSAGPAGTLIGPAAQVKGELVSSENIQIEGKVEGKIKSTKQVVIGEKGNVQAEVEAQIVSIRGKLQGDCVASEKVEITGSGQVYGNISAPRIAVAEGAIFRGASNMSAAKKAAAPAPSLDSKPSIPVERSSPESTASDQGKKDKPGSGQETPPSGASPKVSF